MTSGGSGLSGRQVQGTQSMEVLEGEGKYLVPGRAGMEVWGGMQKRDYAGKQQDSTVLQAVIWAGGSVMLVR